MYCYRCDNFNHGSTCDAHPATRYLRDYGDEEPCLQYEEVNEQYLALQKHLDPDWYFSPKNGDHGLPFHILLPEPEEAADDDSNEKGALTLIHADKDFACLYVRSTFHHNTDFEQVDVESHPANMPHTVYFRKCVQLPSLDIYPICKTTKIYKGNIEICVCRTDKCNLSHLDNPEGYGKGRKGVNKAIRSSMYPPLKHYYCLFIIISIIHLLK